VKHNPNDANLVLELKTQQKMVKSHITKFIKTQGEHILQENNSRDCWKFIKNVTNTSSTKMIPPVSTGELNNFFARAV